MLAKGLFQLPTTAQEHIRFRNEYNFHVFCPFVSKQNIPIF